MEIDMPHIKIPMAVLQDGLLLLLHRCRNKIVTAWTLREFYQQRTNITAGTSVPY
jgi:hypothetical protein